MIPRFEKCPLFGISGHSLNRQSSPSVVAAPLEVAVTPSADRRRPRADGDDALYVLTA
jgi:hypothetical protein